MRLSIVIILSLCFYGIAISAPQVSIQEVSWSVGDDKNIPSRFSLLDSSTTLPLKDSYWLKISVNSNVKSVFIIEAGSAYMQGMSYYDEHHRYLFSGNHQQISLVKGGNIFYIYYPFRDFKSTEMIRLIFHEKADYYQQRSLSSITETVFLSVVLFLFFLSVSFYITSKMSEIIYLHYAWYLASIVLFFSYQYGVFGALFPFINQIPPPYVWTSSSIITISYLFFAQAFLDLRNTDSWLFKILNFSKVFILGVIIFETAAYYFGYDIQHSIVYKGFVLLIQTSLMPYFLYRCYLQKTTLSWIFICGALILVITTIVGQSVSTFKAVSEVNLYIQIGLLIEIFIFSIGLALRMVIINKDKRIVQHKLIDQLNENERIQRSFINELEEKVAERTEELEQRNEEKGILLKEIHHRVKNNLQTISSLLSIQQRKLSDPAAINAIEDSKNRVQVMGLLHKFLYQHDNFEEISIKPYLEQLMKMLVESHKVKTEVKAQVDVCDIEIDVDTSINIGLIVNELIINSLKHASPIDSTLNIVLRVSVEDQLLSITLSDNGQVITSKPPSEKAGFGWRLVQSLVEKTGGELRSSFEDGFIVNISIPIGDTKAYEGETSAPPYESSNRESSSHQ